MVRQLFRNHLYILWNILKTLNNWVWNIYLATLVRLHLMAILVLSQLLFNALLLLHLFLAPTPLITSSTALTILVSICCVLPAAAHPP